MSSPSAVDSVSEADPSSLSLNSDPDRPEDTSSSDWSRVSSSFAADDLNELSAVRLSSPSDSSRDSSSSNSRAPSFSSDSVTDLGAEKLPH